MCAYVCMFANVGVGVNARAPSDSLDDNELTAGDAEYLVVNLEKTLPEGRTLALMYGRVCVRVCPCVCVCVYVCVCVCVEGRITLHA
jgi:hypothetical protein